MRKICKAYVLRCIFVLFLIHFAFLTFHFLLTLESWIYQLMLSS